MAFDRFAIPEGSPILLDRMPRLESWDRAGHPSQVALRDWLDYVHAEIQRAAAALDGELALRLDVGLPGDVDPLWQRDLDNYLFPIARGLSERFVSCWATKGRGIPTALRVGPAERVSRGAAWVDVAAAQRGEGAWKVAVAHAVSREVELPPGPVAVEVCLAVGHPARWAEIWKPTLDGLGQLLGSAQEGASWNPQDGRIVRLGFHRSIEPALGRNAAAAVAVHPVPRGWPEVAWLDGMSDDVRGAYLDGHLRNLGGRAARQRPSRRLVPAIDGVAVFADDDAGYRGWLRQSNRGYVVNVLRSRTGEAILHRDSCWTISAARPARGGIWTGEYIKVCAGHRRLLEAWLDEHASSAALRPCGTCHPL